MVAGNYNITIGDCVSGNTVAAASDGLSTDAMVARPSASLRTMLIGYPELLDVSDVW